VVIHCILDICNATWHQGGGWLKMRGEGCGMEERYGGIAHIFQCFNLWTVLNCVSMCVCIISDFGSYVEDHIHSNNAHKKKKKKKKS
jgi:hypothetical protein